MQVQPEVLQPDRPQTRAGIAGRIEGEHVTFGPGIAASVSANQDASFSKGVSTVIAAGRDAVFSKGSVCVAAVGHDLDMQQGGSMLMTVGGNVGVDRGGAFLVNAGGDVQLDQGGAGVAITPQVNARRSLLGLVLAASVHLSDNSRVLITTRQAAAFGAVFGVVFGLFHWLSRRR